MTQYTRWTAAEADFLEQLAGEVPFPTLLRRMKIAATQHGWHPRSEKAITMRLFEMRLIRRSRYGEWTTTYGVGQILQCPGYRVAGWLRQKKVREILNPRTIGGIRYVSRQSWRRLAREMPQVLSGFSGDALFLLVEDRELADAVAAQHPRPISDHRIRCIETGQAWPSCAAAARDLHVTRAAISCAIRERRAVRVLGMTFEALRQAA